MSPVPGAPTLEDISAARERIAPFLATTPVVHSRTLDQATNRRVTLKAELFCRTGSFKAHGALNAVLGLSEDEKRCGVTTVSAGNHGQALAFAARMNGVDCRVFMREGAVQAKINAIHGYGAVTDYSPTMAEAFQRMEEFSTQTGATIIHPFADPAVIAGQGVVGLEILEQSPDVEEIVIPVGGGGLACGVAIAVKSLKPEVRIVGVEPEGSAAVSLALQAGQPVQLESNTTVADGLAAPFTTDFNLAIFREYIDDVVLVSDPEIIEAMRFVLERVKVLAEPAGAAGVAAAMTNKTATPIGANSVIILTGGNIDAERLANLITASN